MTQTTELCTPCSSASAAAGTPPPASAATPKKAASSNSLSSASNESTVLSRCSSLSCSLQSLNTTGAAAAAAGVAEDGAPPSPPVADTGKARLDHFEMLSVLGKGAYGKVFQVRKTTGSDRDRIYALKSISKTRIIDSRTDTRHTRAERDVLASVEHPFLIKLYYAFETRQRLYFVQEFCKGGELFRLMERERMLLEDHARFYLCEIACALEYLHELNIVYRDLKTENIMLDARGHIKLIDFGLSKMFDANDELTKTFCGTVEYMAPEVVVKEPGHGKPADWWSFGVFAFDLLTGRSPFCSNRGKKETKERILRAKYNIPHFVTPQAADLIRRLLRKNVERRLGSQRGAIEIKSHIFFAGTDWQAVLHKELLPPYIPNCRKAANDISQFDPRFTNRSPRESLIKPCPAVAEPPAVLFPDFDYVAPEVQATLSSSATEHIRGHGD